MKDRHNHPERFLPAVLMCIALWALIFLVLADVGHAQSKSRVTPQRVGGPILPTPRKPVPPNEGLPVSPCNADACSDHQVTPFGYCHYQTVQTAHTFSLDIEVGIASTPADPNVSLCFVPLPRGGTLVSFTGAIDYVPMSGGPNNTIVIDQTALRSMVVIVRTCDTAACAFPADQDTITTVKVAGDKVVPIGQHLVNPLSVVGFFIIFNDDLGKPNVINVAFAGELQ